MSMGTDDSIQHFFAHIVTFEGHCLINVNCTFFYALFDLFLKYHQNMIQWTRCRGIIILQYIGIFLVVIKQYIF